MRTSLAAKIKLSSSARFTANQNKHRKPVCKSNFLSLDLHKLKRKSVKELHKLSRLSCIQSKKNVTDNKFDLNSIKYHSAWTLKHSRELLTDSRNLNENFENLLRKLQS